MREPIIPTDEEITALRRAEWDSQEHWDSMGEKYHKVMTGICRAQFSSEVYQAFILRKMADAFEAGVDAHNDAFTYGKNEIINPYREKP